ncbi:site-specific tyrosine recombinase XerD [Dermatobacter hominis]|uniref:site-specific tyrosine recombinase XerD n=1 Tax=Dermatobacter hominis TaxID=2884263 RepID=UPI001D11C968|nr:site-specific tyrosine recombinase XerD [Dermatobacter hominis]UDY36253.1 site-specific tyrosine recombinase XerD [Dermatobacter hominis]
MGLDGPPEVDRDGVPVAAAPFLTHLAVEKGRSDLTLRAYRQDLRRYAAFLADRGLEVDGVGEDDVQDFVTELRAGGLATSSVIRVAGTVRSLHRFLAAEGLAPADPTAAIETPRRPSALPRALSEQQVEALLDAVGSACELPTGDATADAANLRDRALLELLYSSGIRVSEACGLRFGDLDVDSAFARVLGKRSKERLVPIGRPALSALADYLDRGRPVLLGERPADRDAADAVFLGLRGRRLGRQAAWGVIRRWATAAGLTAEISPHVLRHSCATHLLDHGADIRTVQELLGHASVSTTQIYTRVATDRLLQAYRDAHPRARARSTSGAAS